MGARQKLNSGYVNGSLFLAALAGAVTQSFLVFAITLTILLVVNFNNREIRPQRPEPSMRDVR